MHKSNLKHSSRYKNVVVPLCSEPLDVLGEEEGDVLHELLAHVVIVTSHLQGTKNIVQETLVQVEWHQLEKN